MATLKVFINQVGVEGIVSDMNTPNEFKFKTGWLNVEYADLYICYLRSRLD